MKSLKLHLFVFVCALVGLCASAWATEPALTYGQPVTGTISAFAQVNRYTVAADKGDVLDFTLLSTKSTSGTFSGKIQLMNSTGTVLDSAFAENGYGGCSGGNTVTMDMFTVPATGTYTVLISDCNTSDEGDYTLYVQRMNNPPDPANLPYSTAVTGTVAAMPEMNAYTFSANKDDVIDFAILSTSSTSGTFSPYVQIFNSAGKQIQSAFPANGYGGCSGGNTLGMPQVSIPATGTFILFVGDCSLWNTGKYSMWMQKMNSPAGAADVLFDQVQNGTISSLAQQVPYTFTVAAGDTVDLNIATTKGLFSPRIQLFEANGTVLQTAFPANGYGGCSGGSTLDVGSLRLSGAGTYYLFVSDCTAWNTGSYQFSTQCFGTCPLPAPTLASLSPKSALAGSPGFTLTANGTNFVNVESNSVVQWSGNPISTTNFVNTGQLKAPIPASAIALAGVYPVTVFTPAPGGGTSPPVDFVVYNPLPTLKSVSPTTITAGGAGFTLTVTGSGFVQGSVLQWNTYSLATTYNSATQLTAQVPAAYYATAGPYPVTVYNPTEGTPPQGGGTSGPVTFTVLPDQPPVLNSPLVPASATAGGPAFTLNLTGANFVTGSVVYWNGNPCSGSPCGTTYVSGTALKASIPASYIATAGAFPVTVQNPEAPIGPSAAVNFIVNNPAPKTVSPLVPASAIVGGQSFPLTVNGSNFVKGSLVQWNGASLTPTSVSAKQLTVQIPASDIAIAGPVQVTVFNPAPGGGTSSPPLTFNVNNPVPVLGSLSQMSAIVGSGAFTLTLTGSNFVATSTVLWGATSLTPTSATATQLQVTVPAASIATAGPVEVAVVNPTPGGGTSGPLNFVVNNPAPLPTLLSPATAWAGGPAFTLTITGSNFVSSSVVYWNKTTPAITSWSPTQLQVSIPASDIKAAGTAQVTVFNPAPPTGGQTSAPLPFMINKPDPPPNPAFSPAAGTYGAGQWVTLSDTAGAAVTIYYTTDGTTPITSSTTFTYTVPILVQETETIKAVAAGTAYSPGNVVSQRYTLIGSPTVLAIPATAITSSGATLTAYANDLDLAGQVWWVYGTSSDVLNSSTPSTALPAKSGAQAVTFSLTGLSPQTTYYVQPVVSSAGGTTYGAILSFTTSPAVN